VSRQAELKLRLALARKELQARRARYEVEAAGGEGFDFEAFVRRRNPTLLDFEHVPKLVSVGQRLLDGVLDRVIVMLPPRYFKSEVFSRLLPAAELRANPRGQVALSSYAAEIAWEMSEEARNYFREDGGELLPETTAKKRWATMERGQLWAAGVGGPALGRGFSLGILDDPTDPEKAHSPTFQKRFERWWPSKWYSRQEPGARMVVVMQRLGIEDPIDFLLRREVGEETDLSPQGWHVVVLDEVRSDEPLGRWDGPMGLPPSCTVEQDDRHLGEVLAPSRFTLEQVKRLQAGSGPYVTSAQRQQRPAKPTGDFWRESWLRVYDELPRDAYDGGVDWDTAYTDAEANSATAMVRSYRGPGDQDSCPIYIEEVDWDWKEFPELVEWLQATKGPHYVEQKASGKSVAQALRRYSVPVQEVKVDGSKFSRASAVQPIVATRRVWVRREALKALLWGDRQGLMKVTAERLVSGGPDLDVNDAFVQALQRHTGRRPVAKPEDYTSVKA
jgi:hypothetical protein